MQDPNAPDFESIIIEKIALPFDPDKKFLRFTFADPKLKDYSLICIRSTINSFGQRLDTIVVRYPRYVHAEALRHRVLSRNAASSRARSVKVTIRDVMENPTIPIFTVNQAGMGGRYSEPERRELQIASWLRARDRAVASVLELIAGPQIFAKYGSNADDATSVANAWEEILEDYYENGYDAKGEPREGYLSTHKQQFNRIIENFGPFEEVVTSSYWDNFLELRDHADAQPEIRAFAVLVRAMLSSSEPEYSWLHAPFIPTAELPEGPTDFDAVRGLLLRSANECAQISYNDKSTATRSTASASKGEQLFALKHYSPFEHQAIDADDYWGIIVPSSDGQEITRDPDNLVSNLDPSWVQLRPILAGVTK